MTKQLTIKLNEDQFQPLIDKLKEFTGESMGASNSDFVAKCLFFLYVFTYKKHPDFGNKTDFELLQDMMKFQKADVMLEFMGEYHEFKMKGVDIFK